MAAPRKRFSPGGGAHADGAHDAGAGSNLEGSVVESVAGSPQRPQRPQSPMTRYTKGHCRRCAAVMGEFFNSWLQITNTYHLPALLGSYTCSLRAAGERTRANEGTNLEGCSIQPLACPGCDEILAFTVLEVLSDKQQSFLRREFFKLPRIELRCDISATDSIVVTPKVDAAPESLAVDELSNHSSPVPVASPPSASMEVEPRPQHPPPGAHHHLRHEQPQPPHHHQAHHHHQPLQQVEANRQSLPPPSAHSPSGPPPLQSLPHKASTNSLPSPSPAVQPIQDAQYVPAPLKGSSTGVANRTRELPPVSSLSQSPAEQVRTNGQYYPKSPSEVQLDAIERLQTQISQNSGALIAQSRDVRRYEESMRHQENSLRREFQNQFHHQQGEIRRVDEAVGRLQHEMRGIRDLLEGVTRELQTRGGDLQAPRGVTAAPGQSVSAQDSALELMAQQVANISLKANEVDTLKITIEIMKNKIQRLEDASAATPASQSATGYPHRSSREPSQPSAHQSHTIPSFHNTPSTAPHMTTPVHPTQRPQSFLSSSVAATPEASHQPEPSQTPGGWVAVNAGTKRTHSNGVDGPHEHVGPAPVGSPKRPKLATLEPRGAYANSQTTPHHHAYDQMDNDDSDARFQTHSHSLPSQSIPESPLSSQQSHAGHAAYTTQEAPSQDSWRPESQRIIEHRPRGRGRGGGPGSRGGRGRKSWPAHGHVLETSEWEREDWTEVPQSQTNPEGGYHGHVNRTGRDIIRRGSGGGGGTSRGGRPPSSSDRAVSLGLQGVTAGVGFGLPADPYAHTKKTRTKPIRNADGVLIRKDGRPDMRSQSSAANLRKVHARKDDQKDERGFTPTNLRYTTTNAGAETPSPTEYTSQDQDITASVQKKHTAIMGKMFPGGVEESRKDHDYARKVFDEEQDHTAHPRAENHHHYRHRRPTADRSPLEIKREQMDEQRLADLRSPNDDVDMDRVEDHADDEDQTPSAQSDNSGQESQYHDATNQQEQEQASSEPIENGAQAPDSTAEDPAGSSTNSR